jgi:hypothetical protein
MVEPMRFILRVWLPDKPGALGRVATAIGSVGASLVAIDILEQEAGWAIDELTVEAVESDNAEEKLLAALHFVEGVQIESLIPSPPVLVDPRVSALETAVEIVEQQKARGLTELLVMRALTDLSADWAVLLQFDATHALATAGEAPSIAWVQARKTLLGPSYRIRKRRWCWVVMADRSVCVNVSSCLRWLVSPIAG